MSLFGSKNNTVAIYDIGSGSVGVCLVELPKDKGAKNDLKTPKIIFSKRVFMTVEDELNFPLFLESMLKAVWQASELLTAANLGVPKDVHCFLHTPWYTAHSRTVHTEKNVQFSVTEDFICQTIDTEIEVFKKTEFDHYRDYHDMNIIERYAIGARINGYAVPDPIGKRGNSLDISLFISLTPQKIIDDIKNAIEKNISLSGRNIFFHSNLCATYGLIRDMFALAEAGYIPTTGLVSVGPKCTYSFVNAGLWIQPYRSLCLVA